MQDKFFHIFVHNIAVGGKYSIKAIPIKFSIYYFVRVIQWKKFMPADFSDFTGRVLASLGYTVTQKNRNTIHATKGHIRYAVGVHSRRIRGVESQMEVIKNERVDKLRRESRTARAIPVYVLVAWVKQDQGTHFLMIPPDSIPSVLGGRRCKHGYNVVFRDLPALAGKEGLHYQFFPDIEDLRPTGALLARDLAEIYGSRDTTDTEKQALVQTRVGQGPFRDALIRIWGKCSVTGCRNLSALRASHIKPWQFSNDQERLDPYNGFLLIPNLDVLFDCGLITFEADGSIRISSLLSDEDKRILRVSGDMRMKPKEQNELYLDYHRGAVFRG